MARSHQSIEHGIQHFPMKAAIVAQIHDIAVIDTNVGAGKGYLEFGREATGLKPVGLFNDRCDNTLGANGARKAAVFCDAEDSVYVLDNSAGLDALVQADVGSPVYITGRRSVGKTDGGGTRSEFGTLVSILTNNKVGVMMKPIGSTL